MYVFFHLYILLPIRYQVDTSEIWLLTADQAAVPASQEYPLVLLIYFSDLMHSPERCHFSGLQDRPALLLV